MIDSVLIGERHVNDQPCKIVRIGRRSDLVIHDPKSRVILCEIQHGLNKVLSVHAEDPGDSQNEELLYMFAHCDFPFRLRLSVDVERFVRILRLPGPCPVAVEYIVRREIHHRNVQLLADLRNIQGPVSIDLPACFRHFLSLIDRSPGRAVDHKIHSRIDDPFPDALRVRNIHRNIGHRRDRRAIHDTAVYFFQVSSYPGDISLCEFIHHVMTELSGYTCD